MAAKKYMTPLAGKKLLVAPLDWGLGHATRCVPIIRDLLNNDCAIWLAGEGAQEKLLREEFPSLPFLPLKGYRVRYGQNSAAGKLFLQIPSLLTSIKYEHKWLGEQLRRHGFDGVISDNRYGLHNKNILSIFMTHQLVIKSPFGSWSEKLLGRWNYRFIERFNECWIPDDQGDNNLAGVLSHPAKLPSIPTRYIGPLSRLENANIETIKDHLLVILSGPEPQRTILEDKIINEVVNYPGSATIVRGLPGEESIIPSTNTIQFYNHLSSKRLSEEMIKADLVISRSGYSTIMDIAALQKKSILIPTPGQTEQEYLGSYLLNRRFAVCARQQEFSLLKEIERARTFDYHI